MKRLVVLLAISAAFGALGAVACGGGNEKPPMTPDEHTQTPTDPTDVGEAGAPADPASPAPAST